MHRKQWRDQPLLPSLQGHVLYALEKLSQGVGSTPTASIGQWGLEHIESQVSKFKSALADRGLL